MKKDLDKINKLIIVVIMIISVIAIVSNLKKVLQCKYYLKIDSSNREYIEKTISENCKLKGTLNKIAYMGGLGDWYLFMYYEDGTEDETLFSESNRNVEPLEKYIVENGYNEGKVSWNKIRISFWTIVITIIYEISYLIIRKKKATQNKI